MFRGDMIITGGRFVNVHNEDQPGTYINFESRSDGYFAHAVLSPVGIRQLLAKVAPGAFHDSEERHDPPKCLPGTRQFILLKDIMDWIKASDKKQSILWLEGMADTGKSMICQSIAELCQDADLLGATFFFSRSADGRNNSTHLIATLAYQLAIAIPQVHDNVSSAIEKDPLIFSRSLEAQLEALILRPLSALYFHPNFSRRRSRPILIILDGLDQCQNTESQRYILKTLSSAFRRYYAPLTFLISSRPEQEICDTFKEEGLNLLTHHIVLNDVYQPDAGTLLYPAKAPGSEQTNQNHRVLIDLGGLPRGDLLEQKHKTSWLRRRGMSFPKLRPSFGRPSSKSNDAENRRNIQKISMVNGLIEPRPINPDRAEVWSLLSATSPRSRFLSIFFLKSRSVCPSKIKAKWATLSPFPFPLSSPMPDRTTVSPFPSSSPRLDLEYLDCQPEVVGSSDDHMITHPLGSMSAVKRSTPMKRNGIIRTHAESLPVSFRTSNTPPRARVLSLWNPDTANTRPAPRAKCTKLPTSTKISGVKSAAHTPPAVDVVAVGADLKQKERPPLVLHSVEEPIDHHYAGRPLPFPPSGKRPLGP